MKKIILLFIILISKFAFGQTSEMSGNDTINKTDAVGKKQGKWIILNKTAQKAGFQDNQKVEEGSFKDSKKTGIWKEYYPNGNAKCVATYVNGLPNGYVKFYHENGKIKEEGMWKNQRWTGPYKMYYENGQAQFDFNFNESGKREGNQKYYYDNGQVMIEGNWAAGAESGILKEYYENGDIKSEKNFLPGGVFDATQTKNYEPKKPIVKRPEPVVVESPPVIAEKTEKPNIGSFTGEGYWKLFNINKQVIKDGIFHNKKLTDGKVYYYNPDGILTRIAIYKNSSYIGDAQIEDEDKK